MLIILGAFILLTFSTRTAPCSKTNARYARPQWRQGSHKAVRILPITLYKIKWLNVNLSGSVNCLLKKIIDMSQTRFIIWFTYIFIYLVALIFKLYCLVLFLYYIWILNLEFWICFGLYWLLFHFFFYCRAPHDFALKVIIYLLFLNSILNMI